MKTSLKIKNHSLVKLRQLTENLVDRDVIRAKDAKLFSYFLENSPIRLCLWTVDSNLKPIHQKCICPISKDTKDLTRRFFEGSFKKKFNSIHKSFIESSLQEERALVGDDNELYAVTLKKDGSNVNGIAIEVTCRVRMLYVLLEMLEDKKEKKDESYELIQSVIEEDHFSLLILDLLEKSDGK